MGPWAPSKTPAAPQGKGETNGSTQQGVGGEREGWGQKIREGKGEQEQLPPRFLTIFLIEQVLDLFPQCVSDVYSGKPGIIIFCKIKKQLWTSAVKLKGTL